MGMKAEEREGPPPATHADGTGQAQQGEAEQPQACGAGGQERRSPLPPSRACPLSPSVSSKERSVSRIDGSVT